MNIDEDFLFMCGCAILVVASLVVAATTGRIEKEKFRKEAVREGHARWVASETGSHTFEWLPPCGCDSTKEQME